LNLPLPCAIEDNGPAVPFFIGDEAFRLTEIILKPYPRRQLTREKRIFNYRLSFARGIVECAFGMLVSKFGIFETPISVHLEKVDNVVMAAVLLHNMVRHEDKVKFTDEELEQLPKVFGSFMQLNENLSQNPRKRNVNQSTSRAREIRDYFCHYFCNAGQVHWQNSKILDGSAPCGSSD
jgi:hypothetical protein